MSSHDLDAMPKSTRLSHRLADGAAQRARSDVEQAGTASIDAFAVVLEAIRPSAAVERAAPLDQAHGSIRGGLLASGMVETLNRAATPSPAPEPAPALPGVDGAAVQERGELGGLIGSGANLVANEPRRVTRSAAALRDGRPSAESTGESDTAEPQQAVLDYLLVPLRDRLAGAMREG